MDLAESLTPQRTEEIKPGLFIQKTIKGKYRQIEPVAWGGKIRWKQQISSVISFRFIFTIAVVLFLVYAYNQDNSELVEFQSYVMTNTSQFCSDWQKISNALPCSTGRQADGSCLLNEEGVLEALKNFEYTKD